MAIRDLFGQLRMNTNKIIGLAAGTAAGDAMRFDEVGDALTAVDNTPGNKATWGKFNKNDTLDPELLGSWTMDANGSDGLASVFSVVPTGVLLEAYGGILNAVKNIQGLDTLMGNADLITFGFISGRPAFVFRDFDGVVLNVTSASLGTGAIRVNTMGVKNA